MTGMGTGDSVVAVAGNSSCANLDGKAGQARSDEHSQQQGAMVRPNLVQVFSSTSLVTLLGDTTARVGAEASKRIRRLRALPGRI